MYIGDTDDGSGLHHMVFEVSDNAIDEALAGHCDRIDHHAEPDGSVRSRTMAAASPPASTPGKGVSAAEVIMTQLHAGGKFNNTRRQCLQGFGRPARRRRQRWSTRLSEWLELTIWRDGEEHWMRFRHGEPKRR
jgi:DNA gyrase subunit B